MLNSWKRIGIILFAVLIFIPFAHAQEEERLHLQADEATYDSDMGIYVARGNVEIQYRGRIVHADTVAYNENTRHVTASGNVVILQPNGDTLFSSYADLTDTLEDGTLEDFRALLADQSRLAGTQARRHKNGRLNELDKALYTPCLPCKEHPERLPIWQIKSYHAVQDKDKGTITYNDAWMEIFGVPVFYTPWFQHADVGVKRLSGLLAPSASYNERSGFQIRQPYFATLGPDKDITFTPILRIGGEPTDDSTGVGVLQYRQRFKNGRIKLAGSGTIEDRQGDIYSTKIFDDDFRGHVEGNIDIDINKNWRAGLDFKNTTDKRYLRRYNLGQNTWLQDRLFLEGFFGRSYATAEALGYQTTSLGLEDAAAPIIGPSLRYNFVGEPGRAGAYWGLDLDFLNLRRRDDYIEYSGAYLDQREYIRFSATPYWTLPYTGSLGDIYNLTLSVQLDGYDVEDFDVLGDVTNPRSGLNPYSGFQGHVLPKGSFDWRWPLAKYSGSITQIIQPMLQVVGSPDCCNTDRIPNEDSLSFELDDARIFDRDWFPGRDRVDNGSRLSYGIDYTIYGPKDYQAEIFLGQAYQFDRGDSERFNSGISDQVSDLVGRAAVKLGRYVDASYRFRYDTGKNGGFSRHQVTFQVGPSYLRLFGSYANLPDRRDDARLESLRRLDLISSQEQAAFGLTSAIGPWSFSAGIRDDIGRDRILNWSAGIRYQDECFGIGLRYFHTDVQETIDSEDDDTFYFYLSFTNLGSIETPL